MGDQRTEVAEVTGPLTTGKGVPFGSPTDVAKCGCVMEEFLVDGVAQSYASAAGTEIGLDALRARGRAIAADRW